MSRRLGANARLIRTGKILPILMCCLFIISLISITTPQTVADQFELSQTSNYITYFGGTNIEDATKVAFDNEGNTILIGQTQSTNLPVTSNAFQPEDGGGNWDAFIAKFSPTGALLFCSYLGGIGYEHITAINVDADNNMVVAGTTESSGLPTTTGALHETPLGLTDGFIFKIAPNGTILFGTYFGGTGEDWIYGMEFDASGNYLFSGWTNTEGLGTIGVHQDTYGGGAADAFVARLSADGSTLQMFSYLGSIGDDRAWSMTIDNSYNFIFSGVASWGYPISSGAYQNSHGGGYDAFLTKVSQDGTLQFSTFLGGAEDDLGLGVDVDSLGNIILAGDTESDNINTLNAIQQDFGGGTNDFFVSKFNRTGYPYYVTYIGGNQTDRCWDARVDADSNLILVGRTSSFDFPALNGLNDTKSGGFDACVTKLSSDGQTIIAATFIGGSAEDIGEGIAVDAEGNIVVTGRTLSSDFPTTNGAYQEESAGLSDVFVCHAPFQSRSVTETTISSTTTLPPPNGDMTLVWVGVVIAIIMIVLALTLVRKR